MRGIVAIELIAAAQGLDFARPRATSPALTRAHGLIRERVAPYLEDRRFAEDIAAIKDLIAAGAIGEFIAAILPSLGDDGQ